jgi:hypothetical protein
MGLRDSKAHKDIYKGVKILHIADDNNKGEKNISWKVLNNLAFGSGAYKQEEEVNLSL